MKQLNEGKVKEILLELAKKSYYQKNIENIIPEIVFLANENDTLNQALIDLIDTKDLQKIKQAEKTIYHFFEYLYFTSENFLKGVE